MCLGQQRKFPSSLSEGKARQQRGEAHEERAVCGHVRPLWLVRSWLQAWGLTARSPELGTDLLGLVSGGVSCCASLLQLESLRASYAALKAQSQEEIRRLWSQLESPGRDSHDPSGEASAVQSSDPRKLTRRLHGRDSCCMDSGRRVVFRHKPEGLGFTVGPACRGWGP